VTAVAALALRVLINDAVDVIIEPITDLSALPRVALGELTAWEALRDAELAIDLARDRLDLIGDPIAVVVLVVTALHRDLSTLTV
jgi:hypothetical protein